MNKNNKDFIILLISIILLLLVSIFSNSLIQIIFQLIIGIIYILYLFKDMIFKKKEEN